MKKKILLLISSLILISSFAGYFISNIDKNSTSHVARKNIKREFKLVAIGDSLTFGVGDSTNKGGYVDLIRKKLNSSSNINVKTSNYGVSGETSTQINKRVKNKSNIQRSIKNADAITITVGGNDLMHIINKKGLNLTKEDVISGTSVFENNLNELISNVRRNNNHAPIYLIGIYNPFGVYLKNIEYMSIAVKNWNKLSEQTASENYNVHFVDIDKLLSQPKKTVLNKDGEVQNPYLYNKDHFHPNNKGYELITDELYKTMMKTKDTWRSNEKAR